MKPSQNSDLSACGVPIAPARRSATTPRGAISPRTEISSIFRRFHLAVLVLVGILFAAPAFAAQFYFGANAPEVPVGQAFDVGVFLNAQGQSVNAMEGSVSYDPTLLHVDAIRDGDSAVTFWIQRPTIPSSCASRCLIKFSGIIPGGTARPDSLLFTLTFTALKTGNATVDVTGGRVLQNDGKGTPASVSTAPLTVSITTKATPIPLIAPEDSVPPEAFTPAIIRDPSVLEGKAAVVFGTQDKGSGIDHYEVAESLDPNAADTSLTWHRAESPALLNDQTGASTVYVKAVDRAGNVRIEKILGSASWFTYIRYAIWGIIVLSILAAVLWRFVWSKRKKTRSH